MKNITITILFLLLGSFCCTTSKSEELVDSSTVVTLTSEIEFVLQDTFFKSSRIIPLETNEYSLLKRINRICSHDGKLFIFDRSLVKIVVFDEDGHYLAHVHRIGSGPFEYLGVLDFCLDTARKQILLLCDRPKKIMKFDYQGNFIKEHKIKDLYMDITMDSRFIYCTKIDRDMTPKSRNIVCLDSNIHIVGELLSSIPHIRSNSYVAGKDLTTTLNLYYVRRFDNAIYQIRDGKVEKKYTINFNEHALPEKVLKDINEVDIHKIYRENKYVYSIVDVSESANFLMFKTNLATFLLDKRSNTLSAFNVILNSKLLCNSSRYLPICNNGQLIASTLEATAIDKVRQSLSRYKEEDVKKEMAERPELEKLLKTVQIDDNPVLLLYELK